MILINHHNIDILIDELITETLLRYILKLLINYLDIIASSDFRGIRKHAHMQQEK